MRVIDALRSRSRRNKGLFQKGQAREDVLDIIY